MTAEANPTVMLPDMCRKHQYLLVHQADYKESDPWRALIVVAQIALMQGATADMETHKRMNGDITKLHTLGCLACYKPDVFGAVVEAAKSHDLQQIKAVGERYLQQAAQSKG
jgi:hypothetical protein